MLGKLIKYDFRSCIRKFGPMWLGLAALAAINGFTIGHVLDNGNITGWLQFALGFVPLILLFVLWTALAIMALVFICERFYKGLLGDEGDLSRTLPVTTQQHIASKLIVATLLGLITALVALVSGALLLAVYKPQLLGEIAQNLRELLSYVDGRAALIIFEYLLFVLVGSAVSTLHIYAAICLGHLAKSHRVAWAIGAYILINVAVSNILALCAPLLEKIPEEWFFTFDELGFHFRGFGAVAGLIGGAIAAELIVGAIYFLVTNYILRNRLNLD